MERFNRTLMLVISAILLASPSAPCRAADSAFRDLGGLTETQAGGALLVFTSNPSDQFDILSIGAATDGLREGASTIARSAKSLITLENGNLKISVPAITPEFQGGNAKGFAGVMVKAELISGTF